MTYRRSRTDPRRLAVVIPATMLVMVLLLVFTAMAVDIGHIEVAHGQMQRAVDAAALAGASGVNDGEVEASSRASTYALLNNIDSESLSEHGVTITVGSWEYTASTFFPLDGTEAVAPNAVRVVGVYPDLPMTFAQIIGIHHARVSKTAVALGGSGNCVGIWALGDLEGNGNIVTDSFDSRVGPYGGANIYSNGDLCSCADVRLVGSVEIHGDAMYGVGYEFDTAGGALEIWGVSGPFGCSVTAPVIDMEEAEANNDNGTIGLTDNGHSPFSGPSLDLILTGLDNLTLDPGTYYFTSMRLTGQATLTVTGVTIIYVSGDARLTGGGLLNPSEDTNNLTIYSTGDELRLGGNSGFWGSIIAPDTEVDLGGTSEFYGILLGGDVDISGTTNLHIDEALVDSFFDLRSTRVALVE